MDVFLGVESGSQRSLTKFRKYTTVEDNKSAIYTLRKYGIEPNYGFIMFEPDSALADVRAEFRISQGDENAEYTKYYGTSLTP